ncbi:MAG: SPOR domain-containing protein [Paracoccaceae bacterium]
MANVQYTHNMGHPGYGMTHQDEEVSSRKALTNMTNFAGGIVSLALIAGVGIWGYKLIVRDVTGIPVVQAAQGEMRVKPDNPGGQLALHQGLAVNSIAATGSAEGPTDQITLAPSPTELTEEDLPHSALTQTEEAAPVEQPEPLQVATALEQGEIDALVKELTKDTPSIEAASIEASPIAESETPEVAATVQPAVFEGAGLKVSLRPQIRPRAKPQAAVIRVAAAATVAQGTNEVDASTLPVGTRLVQLGAYDSTEIAREQWDRLNASFGDYLTGKDRVIQQAKSGGRIFYRLRAMGFSDLSDARRFCSALVAEGADCIPVVIR